MYVRVCMSKMEMPDVQLAEPTKCCKKAEHQSEYKANEVEDIHFAVFLFRCGSGDDRDSSIGLRTALSRSTSGGVLRMDSSSIRQRRESLHCAIASNARDSSGSLRPNRSAP